MRASWFLLSSALQFYLIKLWYSEINGKLINRNIYSENIRALLAVILPVGINPDGL